jgi:hypothetical protein
MTVSLDTPIAHHIGFVARDADFRPVYDLRMAGTGGAESTAATVTPGRKP